MRRFVAALGLVCSGCLGAASFPGPSNDPGVDGGVVEGMGTDGGATGDAGTSDNTQPDGGGGDGGSTVNPCGAAGVLVCDDFEGTEIDTSVWTKVTNYAGDTITFDTSQVRSGSKALHLVASEAAGRAYLKLTNIFPMPATTVWGRVYMYLKSPLPTTHVDLVTALGTSPHNGSDSFGMQDAMFMTNYHSATNEEARRDFNLAPTDKWLCIEWQFKGDTGDFSEWVDGNLVTGAQGVGLGWSVPTFSTLRVGLEFFGGGYAIREIWMDAVAVGTQRIGCLP
jgi:hypothetical protein